MNSNYATQEYLLFFLILMQVHLPIIKPPQETIAGFILEISQSFPKINSKIAFENYTFTIES